MDFTNKIVNLISLHTGLHRFSISVFDVFGAVYLLGLGLPFHVVALAWAGSCILRGILRPLSLLLSEKIGLKRALILGTVVNSGIFLVLSRVDGLNGWLYFYIFFSAVCDIAYWLPYHSYNAVAGDVSSRGKQMGIQLGFVTIARTIAPLAGGIIIVHFGFLSLYITAMAVMLVSAIPLLFAKDVAPGQSIRWKEAIKTIDKGGLVMQIGDGILYMHSFVWTIVLFYLVGNYVTFGGLVTFELLSTAVLFMLLGYFIDKGKGQRITYVGLITIGVVILLRAFLVKTIPGIIVTDVLVAFGMTFYLSSFDVAFYNLAKRTSNTLWFHFFGELGWDIGAALALILSAGLFMAGIPLRFVIVFSLTGLFVAFSVLRKFYSSSAYETKNSTAV